MERKFTDDEIVKAMWCCINDKCIECPLSNQPKVHGCMKLTQNALDLIIRQKAEIESLKEAYAIYEETTGLKLARAETIKEFAERVKKIVHEKSFDAIAMLRIWGEIDNLVKEMTGEHNGN